MLGFVLNVVGLRWPDAGHTDSRPRRAATFSLRVVRHSLRFGEANIAWMCVLSDLPLIRVHANEQF